MSIERARALRKNATEPEKRLWKALRLLRHESLHCRRQPPIGPYYPDFACHRAKLIIELDGEPHTKPKQMKHDAERTRFLESIGYRVVRFWNLETFGGEDEIARYILSLCRPPPPTPPLVGGGEYRGRMSGVQARFELRGRNPDVLTCIANLSNDEVFTPPEFANRMLDTLAEAWAADRGGANIWADKTVKFLDPCAKSGVFLREITSRLNTGLAAEIPDLQARVDHILTKQVFGIAITQLTSLLARRSLYCSKHANGKHSIARSFTSDAGNIWFERMEHAWNNGRCKYCGANRRDYDRGEGRETHAYAFIHTDNIKARIAGLFGDDMQFDVIIGNPPYQLGSSGGDAQGSFAMPIYQKFVQAAKSLDPRYIVMVTPSRWFAGGRGLDEYRSEMLSDTRLRVLVDFPDASDAFPGMDISGGVSYFLWDRSHDGPCNVQTFSGGVSSGAVARRLGTYDVFVRYNTGVSILEKVWPKGVDAKKALAAKVSPTQPFGLRTSFRGAATAKGLSKPVVLKSSDGNSWMARASIPRNDAWIDQWKVILGLAYGERGAFPYWITSAPEILPPGTACTETYLVIDRFDTEAKAKVFASYLRTRFVRFLISLQKYTQHLYSDRFSFVPDLPMNQTWTDEKLYQKYGITKPEIDFIDSMIRPMDAELFDA